MPSDAYADPLLNYVFNPVRPSESVYFIDIPTLRKQLDPSTAAEDDVTTAVATGNNFV